MLPTTFITFISLLLLNVNAYGIPLPSEKLKLSTHEISLEKRYDNSFVNEVMKDNILLNLAYLENKITDKKQIDWKTIEKPFSFDIKLDPNQTFAFHEDVLPELKEKIAITTNAHFNSYEGFKSDGYLFGDGVCHLASLMNWGARDAGLEVLSPTNHDFAKINEIPKEFGTSIYFNPALAGSNALQNLYITNTKKNPIVFSFTYKDEKLTMEIFEEVGNFFQI